jgi:hypothetical protein
VSFELECVASVVLLKSDSGARRDGRVGSMERSEEPKIGLRLRIRRPEGRHGGEEWCDDTVLERASEGGFRDRKRSVRGKCFEEGRRGNQFKRGE